MKLTLKRNFIEFYDYVSVIPLFFYIGLIYQSLCQREIRPFLFAIYILLSDIFVSLLKRFPYPKNSPFYIHTRRPKGASRCDYLSRNTEYSDESPGFPSGHMTTTALFSTYQMMNHPTLNYIIIHGLLVIVMGMARYYKKCHTLLQIGTGTLLGIGFGLLYVFGENYFNGHYT